MGTQVVRHRSRTSEFKFNWEANNAGAWSFIPKDDGEIYLDDKNNIDSYQIDGGAVSLPYSVNGGQTYSITITKTTPGQSADLSFNIRKSIDSLSEVTIPDFTQNNEGRYFYVLQDNNQLLKYDCNLLIPSNWGGSSWTVTPLVSTITLPTLPNSTLYTYVKFVKVSGISRILIGAKDLLLNTLYYLSYVDITTNTISGLDFTGSYTTINSGGLSTVGTGNGQVRKVQYDYLNNLVYIQNNLSPNTGFILNLNTNNSDGLIVYNGFIDSWVGGIVGNNLQFRPTDNRWINLVNIDLLNQSTFDYITFTNNSNVWGYYEDLNAEITSANSLYTLRLVNRFTDILSITASVDDGSGSTSQFNNRNICPASLFEQVFMSSGLNFAIFDIANTIGKKGNVTPVSGSQIADNCLFSNYSQIFAGLESSGSAYFQRVNIFKYSESPMRFGYIDTPQLILDSAMTNLNV